MELGAVLARAGEGTIQEVVGHPQWVAKVFHPDLKDRVAKCAKVAAMIKSPPRGAVQSDGFAVLTWPLHMVDDDKGPVGYVMQRVDTSNAVEIHTLSNPSDRLNPLAGAPQWTPHVSWSHLVNVAANLCLAVDVVHRVDAVIGDFQERNILVNDTTRVTLVDCDSMQFADADGRQFLCAVGRPEFTAPELAGVNLAVTARDKPSDLFALAVHIHLLLMAGNHPFLRGNWTGGGEQPDAMTLAKTGHWAGGPKSPLRTHSLAPSVDFLPDDVQRLFARAFTDGASDPQSRPTAAQWRQALQRLKVRDCGRGHQVPLRCEQCPWCRIDDERAARKARRAETPRTTQAQTVLKIGSTNRTAPRTASASGFPPASPWASSVGRPRATVIVGALCALAVFIAVVVIAVNLADTDTTPSPSMGPHDSPYLTTTTTMSRPVAPERSLNVSVPMSHPPCDGSGIVVLANSVTPGRYDAEIQGLLNNFPGASYLRTDESCLSLRQHDDAGNAIYTVYRPAGRTVADICAAVRAAGRDAYGKWLDNTTDPKFIIPC